MFDFFRRLFFQSAEGAAPPVVGKGKSDRETDDFARLNSEVPLKSAREAGHAFVRREAVLNRAEKIAGYEFSLLTSLQARTSLGGNAARRAYDAALLARLSLHGVTSLLGGRLAFLNLSAGSLDSALIDRLAPQNTVLILDLAVEATNREALHARLAELRQKGFILGVNHAEAADGSSPLLAEADFIQIDVTAFNGLDLRELSRNLKKVHHAGRPAPQLVARNVLSHDDYQFCHKSGFDLFQGAFISSRESLHPVGGGVNHMAVLHIVDMLLREQSFSAIAEQLKNEPTLSYKLLRYINSAAMGLQQPVNSLTEALVLLGRLKFARWTSLLLFDFVNPTYREISLAERALTRGRTLELLAGKGSIPNDPAHLFLIGLFSLLDKVLGQPLPELLEKAALPDVVRDALLGSASRYACALALVGLGESDSGAEPEQLAGALALCGIDDACYMQAAIAALVWTEQTLGGVA